MLIYVHLPFCKAKCQYCDFNSYADTDAGTRFSYLSALKREIEYAAKQYGGAAISSIYIGGGTPSLLDAKSITSISDVIRRNFDLSGVKEFTIEANPESVTEEKLAAYREAGIDRISLGAQSLDDRNLRSIGRLHDAATAIEKLKLAGRYFENVSADVIVGLPYDNAPLVEREVKELAPLVKHISAYMLTLEEGTPLKRRVDEGRTLLPTDDEVADMFDAAIDALNELGFERYEVSNFAREGYFSRHNMGYWKREEYLGFGAGAHSFIETADGKEPLVAPIRYADPKDINAYIAGINCVDAYDKIPRVDMNVLTKTDILNEQIMLGLRTSQGVPEELISSKIPPELEEFFIRKDGKISLSRRGFEVMNGVLLRIMTL